MIDPKLQKRIEKLARRMTKLEIAEHLGISYGRVRRALLDAGVEAVSGRPTVLRDMAKVRRQVEMYGVTVVAGVYGVTRQAIYKRLSEDGE